MMRIWKRHAKEIELASLLALPATIRMVVNTGQRNCTVPEGIGEMIATMQGLGID